MNDSIAIIGVAFELPNIKNWNDLKNSLSDNTSAIGEMPEERLKEIQNALGNLQMAKAGYLKEIDKFDNEYFGFTERESVKTFPEHRLFLTHAMRAFYHAGYCEASLKGSKTGIFFTASKSAYYKYGNVADMSFGHVDFVNGIEGTRLAKYLDTRGPVISINTSCSSSLVAINVARQSLNDNECDMAIVGGAKIVTIPQRATVKNVVHSKKGECRPFDQEADGMVNGEGAIFFVLKRYEKALRDGDAILGEIRGIGINHGGGRISSLAAPSSDAQKEVIMQAWEKAKIDPGKIRYIEAHGTATILGDPIEIEGIKQAFREANITSENASCGLSSFKGQIGHLDYLAGLAGLLRLVAALNLKVIPVQPNFKTLNKYFHIEDTGLYVPTQIRDWPGENGERIGGVSSYGMTGTNAHLVVSQKDAHLTNAYGEKRTNYLQISHKGHQKLAHYKDYILERIAALDSIEEVHQLCLKLNRIFQIDKVNQGIIYTSKESLILSLRSKDVNIVTQRLFLLLDTAVVNYSKEFIQSLFMENVFIKQVWDQHISLSLDSIQDQYTLNVLFQYAIYKYLIEKLGAGIKFIAPKGGSILSALIKSEITVSEMISAKNDPDQSHHVLNEELFRKYLQDNLANEEITVIDFSGKDKNRFNDLNLKLNVIAGSLFDEDRFLLYSNMVDTGVNPLQTGFNPVFNDIDLPYFSPKRFWPDVQVNPLINKTERKNTVAAAIESKTTLQLSKDEVAKVVRNSWATILETDDFKEEDDFFEIGGTSLAALEMIDEIGKNIAGVKIPYESIYSHATIPQLTAIIYSQLTGASKPDTNNSKAARHLSRAEVVNIIRNSWALILETNDFKEDDDFFDIGGTSLAALEMIDEIGKQITGVKIPYEEIYSCATIAKLSDKIMPQLGISAVADDDDKTLFDSTLREARYNELLRDLRKEDLIKRVPDNILITGGTGLLGMNILNYLINHTQARLYCLVRKGGYDSAAQRFWSVYENYFEIEDKGRITVIEGDLYAESLGIKDLDEVYKIDMIFHVAGSPQFMSQKTIEEHINFSGTRNVVEWANNQKIKKLTFVSTIGVVGKKMPTRVENFYETDTNLGQQSENLIHGASKLKAEEYINNHYNYKAKIFRIPNIGGRLDDGTFPTDLNKNLMWLRLKSLSELKCYCEELLNQNSGIGFIPVDIVSALIAEISFAEIAALNVYHIVHRKYFTNGEVLSSLKKIGIPLEPVSYDNFITYISENDHKMNFHQVAQKENRYKYRADATNEIISRLNLDSILYFDTQVYLDRLIGSNLKHSETALRKNIL